MIIFAPSAFVARRLENLVIAKEKSNYFAVKIGYGLIGRLISITVFPIFLAFELVFKRIPKLLLSMLFFSTKDASKKINKNVNKIVKFCLGILFSPLGIRSPDGVSGLFLKAPTADSIIRPYGVEEQYGKAVNDIQYPTTIEALQELIKDAKKNNKQVSIIGAGMSQGIQTIPDSEDHLVINTKNLNQIEFSPDTTTVTVQSGATWEQLQLEADKRGKSVIVKQASDIFSIGGSIAINCHGWAHDYGSIASTVESLDIIDASGELKTIKPEDELFGCMFGTLGYFGVIVNVTLKLVDNEYLIEQTIEVDPTEFTQCYKDKIKGHDIPLFGGRLVLDNLDGDPLRRIFMVRYEREAILKDVGGDVQPKLIEEPKNGTRMQRVALQALSHLSYFTSRRLISRFWSKEKEMMLSKKRLTRNEALHPPINAFKILHKSNLHAQWLQEYFIKEENLSNFLALLGKELKTNKVRLINATIRPTPVDTISVLPYAEQDRYAVVICFGQIKTEKEMEKTKAWISKVNDYVIDQGDTYYQAYMPYTTQEQFEKCYGKDRIKKLRDLKKKYDPDNLFGNAHTKKYYDINQMEKIDESHIA